MIKFNETQRFNQWWIWLIFFAILGFLVYGSVQQLIQGEPFGNKPAPNWGLILSLALIVGLMVLFRLMKLVTLIDETGIQMRFVPFVNKSIPWEEIETAEVIDYGFVGGWGIRVGTRYGTVYNTSGRIGLALVLQNGKKLCIGTQKENELKKQLLIAKQEGKLSDVAN